MTRLSDIEASMWDDDGGSIEPGVAILALRAVLDLAEKWRYKGEFGGGAWQEGDGPDLEGSVLDSAAYQLRAAISEHIDLTEGATR